MPPSQTQKDNGKCPRQQEAERRYEAAHAEERRDKKRAAAQRFGSTFSGPCIVFTIVSRRKGMSASEREELRARQRDYAAKYRAQHRGHLRGRGGVERYQYVLFYLHEDCLIYCTV